MFFFRFSLLPPDFPSSQQELAGSFVIAAAVATIAIGF
jgi:hypothetical protein